MKSKDLWCWGQWQSLDVLKILFLSFSLNLSIGFVSFIELVIFSHSFWFDVLGENGLQETFILIIGDTTTVIDYTTKIVDDVKWNLFAVIQDWDQLFQTCVQILISEWILFVPTNGTEFSSIQDNGMEEAETKDKFLEL